MCRVKFKDDREDPVEIYFFDVGTDENNTNMLFTSNYFNPIATGDLLVKLMAAAGDYNFFDSIGFIGIIKNDNTKNVEHNIDKAFAIFLKRIEFAVNQAKSVKNIDSLSTEEVIEKFLSIDDEINFFPSHPLVQNELPKQPEGRVLRPRNPKPALVDLTTVEDKTLDDSLAPSEIYLCCSDITETDDTRDDSTTIQTSDYECHKFIKQSLDPDGLDRWFGVNDFSQKPDDHDEKHPTYTTSLHEMEESLLEQFKKGCQEAKIERREKEKRHENSSILSRHLEKTQAFDHYSQKSAQDRGETTNKTASAKGRGESRNSTARNSSSRSGSILSHLSSHQKSEGNSSFQNKPRLLDKEDYEKYCSAKKNRLNESLSSRFSMTPKWRDSFKIPKKNSLSPERQPSSSVIEKSPTKNDKIKGRPPLRAPSKIAPTRSSNMQPGCLDGNELILKKVFGKSPEGCHSPNGYNMFPQKSSMKSVTPQKLSMEAESSTVNSNEIVVVEDDEVETISDSQDDGENNDRNNNGRQKRKLLNTASPVRILRRKKVKRLFTHR